MNWMQRLDETYELAMKLPEEGENPRPLPTSHIAQQAYIEITLDENGKFLDASVVNKEETLLPVTEDSATRAHPGSPHALCDKIQYIAADYPKYGGKKPTYYEDFGSDTEKKDGYKSLLTKWFTFEPHPKLRAVKTFIEEGSVVERLAAVGILHVDEHGQLLTHWENQETMPPLFKLLAKKDGVQDQGDALVRWRVRIPGELEDRVWKDETLITSWQKFDAKFQDTMGICMITGETVPLGTKHPAALRHGGDKAKLLSSNDTSGYTFRGRFTEGKQACSVGYDVTQKAHSALRWLIKRQSFRNEDQVIVSWEPSGKTLPPLAANSLEAFFEVETGENIAADIQSTLSTGDIGQEFALKLKKKISGWSAKLGEADRIIVMGLDSATPGRMAITLYRDLKGSDFLHRLEDWHTSFAWHQRYSKDVHFIGAPSPKDIADAAYGRRIDVKLSKATVERILPCIVDGVPIPQDLVRSTCFREAGSAGLEFWEWRKILGIACGLYRGSHKERGYSMALETQRNTRDYLFGRLLAVAENIESYALFLGGEKRDTNAAKLMHRFSERPNTTWLLIRQALTPYITRLQSQRPAFLYAMNKLLGEIHSAFVTEDFLKDTPLSGEFLLGFYCQRHELVQKKETEGHDDTPESETENILQEEE